MSRGGALPSFSSPPVAAILEIEIMAQAHRSLLIVIADGEHARFLRPTSHRALENMASFTSEAAHQHSADLGADRPGASFHSQSTAHHAVAPRHDLHVMAKEKFARKVAAEIDAMVEREAIDDLVIAAPPPIMSAITATLQDATGRRIIASTHKDFTKMPEGDLWPHLAEWIRPAHLPPA